VNFKSIFFIPYEDEKSSQTAWFLPINLCEYLNGTSSTADWKWCAKNLKKKISLGMIYDAGAPVTQDDFCVRIYECLVFDTWS